MEPPESPLHVSTGMTDPFCCSVGPPAQNQNSCLAFDAPQPRKHPFLLLSTCISATGKQILNWRLHCEFFSSNLRTNLQCVSDIFLCCALRGVAAGYAPAGDLDPIPSSRVLTLAVRKSNDPRKFREFPFQFNHCNVSSFVWMEYQSVFIFVQVGGIPVQHLLSKHYSDDVRMTIWGIEDRALFQAVSGSQNWIKKEVSLLNKDFRTTSKTTEMFADDAGSTDVVSEDQKDHPGMFYNVGVLTIDDSIDRVSQVSTVCSRHRFWKAPWSRICVIIIPAYVLALFAKRK